MGVNDTIKRNTIVDWSCFNLLGTLKLKDLMAAKTLLKSGLRCASLNCDYYISKCSTHFTLSNVG